MTAGIIIAPVARLYGPRLSDRAHRGLVARAGRRDADPLDAGRQPRARRAGMSPACSASISPMRWKAAGTRAATRPRIISSPMSIATRRASRRSVVGRIALSPLDLERRFGLIGGDIFHGKMGLDQLFSNRPMLGHADYRMPLQGSLSLRRGRASRRRRHRRARAQCGQGGDRRPAEAPVVTVTRPAKAGVPGQEIPKRRGPTPRSAFPALLTNPRALR